MVEKIEAGQPADKQINISKVSLSAAAKKKVALTLAKPEMQRYVEQMTRQAEDAFLQEKGKRQLESAQNKKQLDDQIDAEQKKLDANCQYDFPTQLLRVASQLLQIDMRVQDGMLTVGDFKTDVPVINAGKVMLGGHPLMDLPVIKNGQIEIGGTPIAPVATIAGGAVLLPTVIVAKILKIDIPKVDVPVKIGGGNDGHGLNMQVGNWKF